MAKDLSQAPLMRGFVFELADADGRLSLYARHHPRFGGIHVDWGAPDIMRRIAAGKRQLLARAVGLHKRPGLTILDATGGLGRDAFTLAALGAHVSVAERQPMILQLLVDGRLRALRDPTTSAAAERLQILEGDARARLRTTGWDVIFLDPMYPGHERDERSKKEMQFLRELTTGDADAAHLLDEALAARPGRVVVKRPRSAARLGEREPSFELAGTQARFDVYLFPRTPVE